MPLSKSETTQAVSLPGSRLGSAGDPAFFHNILDRLEQARQEIEKRFLGAGDVLVEAHENIQVLVQALDRISGSWDAKRADRTVGALREAIADLESRVQRESGRDESLQATARKLAAIQGEIGRIRAILGYLGTCAVSTRITAAGNDKFMSFADEIANYVRKAEQEIAGFASKVAQMAGELDRVGEAHKQVVDLVGAGARSAAPHLVEAARAIELRRAELESLARRATPAMHAAADKFAKALSALQIGDLTRQRIEHVQDNIRAVLDLSRRDDGGVAAPALKLLHALTAALSKDFDADARDVVSALRGVAGDARAICESVNSFAGQRERLASPAGDIKNRLDAMRHLVEDIDEAGRRSAQADATVTGLAVELLDNRGDIGNLRNVQGNIRLLAINAYLHCSRMGDLGRSIGVIATEISAEGDKLGRSANAILLGLGELVADKDQEADAKSDLLAELDGVGRALQDMDAESGGGVDLIVTRGETIAARIEAAVRGLDFGGLLGEQLAACAGDLQQALANPGSLSDPRPESLSAFSDAAYAGYTMKCERDLHLTIFPDARARIGAPEIASRKAADGEVDDFLL